MKNLSSLRAFAAFVTIAVIAMSSATPVLSAPDDEYKKMRGYVDFAELGIFDKIEPSVEVFLKGPLLKLAKEAVKHEDADLSSALEQIKLIRVHVFPLEDWTGGDLTKGTKKLAEKLEKKGWELAIRVREDDEDVHVYMLPGKNDDIDGLVVMVVEDEDEAVFVNIVGKIDPEQIGRIGHSIHIDGLDMYDFESNIKTKSKKKDRK